jgi:hypothetical protein
MKDEKIKIYLKMFTALAFVPIEHVFTEFNKLKANIPDNMPQCIYNFIQYFKSTYLKSEMFISQWNAVYRIKNDFPLTTNLVEAFNNSFSNFVDHKHPNLACFLSNLQLNQVDGERKIDDALKNPNNIAKDKKIDI